jgi:uncharacterized protein HemX
MVYLIGEVLAFLAAAALIGAGMAWMLQRLRSNVRERRLLAEIQDARSGREAAEAAARALTASLNDLRAETERETGRLKARIAELEGRQPAFRTAARAPGRAGQAARAGWHLLVRAVSHLADLLFRAVRRLVP